jgi:COMPASS component SWD3
MSGDSLDYKDGIILAGSHRTKDQVQLYDFKQRKLIKDIPWAPGEDLDNFYIYTAQFSKVSNDTLMCGSSGLNEVKIFDTNHDHKPTCHISAL